MEVKVSIIIPVYNSEKTISRLVDVLINSYTNLGIEIILVDDSSRDNSAKVITELANAYPGKVKAILLSKNFGEHQAVMAGLNYAVNDYAVIIDDDFQNPPSEILKIVSYAVKEKKEIVYGVYSEKKHSLLRNLGSQFNGFVANYLIDKPRGLYLSSFKCMSRFVYSEIIKYKGPFPYIDGLIFRVTNNVGSVLVEHNEREEGHSNYTLRRLVKLWTNMVFNFSSLPLRMITFLGCFFSFFGLILASVFIFQKIQNPTIAVGWTSVIVAILFFSGIQLIILGVIGEYVGRMFFSGNETPQYVVRKVTAL